MRKYALLSILVMVILLSQNIVSADCTSSTTSLVSDETCFTQWVPIIILAVFLGVMITIIYYVIGYLLNNNRIKANALVEFTQAIGTIFILVLIIAILSAYGSTISTVDSGYSTAVQDICNTQLSSSPINITNSMIQGGPTANICNNVITANSGLSPLTTSIDYGLASTYMIVANMTSQAAVNLNAINVLESYYTSLAGIEATNSYCVSAGDTCEISTSLGSTVTYKYQPFITYGRIRSGTLYIAVEADTAYYMGLIELIGIILLLFGWPYMLAAGFILRASFFTRRAGGLLLAIVLGGLVLYPFLTLFEYSALTNTQISPIGANSIQPLLIMGRNTTENLCGQGNYPNPDGSNTCCQGNSVFCSTAPTGSCVTGETEVNGGCDITYFAQTNGVNFYVLPNLSYVINYYGCWPPGGSVISGVVTIAGSYAIPGVGQFLAIRDLINSFDGSIPNPTLNGVQAALFGSTFQCTPGNLMNTILAMSNFYGESFMASVILPIFNLLIIISGIRGLALLLGGDTTIQGLTRLI